MPLKLSVGLTKKVGMPNYGSLGASCHVEVELAGSILQHDSDRFQRHVRNAFSACRRAVMDELARPRRNGNSDDTDEDDAPGQTQDGSEIAQQTKQPRRAMSASVSPAR
jgi:hypothetical protein